jgi:phage terminase large subunit-like protein
VPEGKLVGQPVQLRKWQRDLLIQIYGSPTRRAIISFGRKNGKTALSAFLLLLHLCGPEARPNSQLFSAAQSREQAAVLFNLGAKCVRMSPDLSAVVQIRDTAKELLCPELGTRYRALSAEASTAYGLSPVFTVHDELGQVRGPRSELYEALETASGAHEEPLSVIISTQAPTDGDLLSVLIDDAKKGDDKRVKLALFTSDPDADPFDQRSIKQANPAFGDFQNAEETLAMAEDARRMPSREAEYRNLILNQRVEANNPFISKTVWQENGGAVTEWADKPVYAGLDLSSTADLTAFVPICHTGDAWETKPVFWLPGVGLEAKSRNDREVYDVWHSQGFLQTTPGRAIEYEFVAEWLFGFCSGHNVQKIAVRSLEHEASSALAVEGWASRKSGLTACSKSSGRVSSQCRRLSATRRQCFSRVNCGTRTTRFLTMCAANAVVTTDPAGGRKLNKAKAAGRIDGMVALAMAFGVAPSEVGPSVEDWLASIAA